MPYMALGESKYTIQTSDVMYKGETADVYMVEFYSFSGYSVNGTVSTKHMSAEQNYRAYVYDTYLQLPNSTKEQVLSFLVQNGIYADSEAIVQDVLNLFNSYTYNLQYDQTLDGEDDVVVSFLLEYKTGICQHFASSATVMYRTLGIPARYVGGLYVGGVKGGEWQIVTANAAHAWVEIYVDSVGWVRVDPTAYAQVHVVDIEVEIRRQQFRHDKGDYSAYENHQSRLHRQLHGFGNSGNRLFYFEFLILGILTIL